MNLFVKICVSFGLILLSLYFISAKPLDHYTCGDICTEDYDPYCVIFKNGTVAEFTNVCKLELETCKNKYEFLRTRSGACIRVG
ncbi:hypothetical protein FF38_02045 [Lucilia cuprina]|uniref:Kazal-like domain-containing protein n=1 Tax=Lucilia cuprina TaxID=7375 RepID=A0A0L0BYD1_LUCCU|nr:hypothetical protein CVS40_9965 [Lucilia cuprina]KNC24284.1 hypothetical protein FF38_02045 [Lucilia cuprina]